MAHEYNLRLIIKDTGEEVVISGEFGSDIWKRLEEFSRYADDLLATKFVQDGMPASLKICWDKQSGMEISTKLPVWDDVVVFLHKFRPIGLQSEGTYFFNICNLLTKEIAHPYFRSIIEVQREFYSGKIMQAQFLLRSDEVVVNSEKVLWDWLNSYEYHRNQGKREFIDSLHTVFPLNASKVLFLSLLTDKTKAIAGVAAFVRVLLGKQESVEGLTMRPN
jgi:hypothetical protein